MDKTAMRVSLSPKETNISHDEKKWNYTSNNPPSV